MTFDPRRLVVVCCVGVAVLMGAAPASAGPSRAKARLKARALFIKGNKLFAKKDYRGALKHYRAARRLYASYKIDFNIGTTLELMKLPHSAAAHFERFVLRADRDKEMPIVKMAWTKLLELRKKVVRVVVRCPLKGAEVWLAKRRVGSTPLRFAVYLLPGQHTMTFKAAKREDHHWTFTSAAGAEERYKVPWGPNLKLLSYKTIKPAFTTPPPVRRRPAATPFYKEWWFWTGVGVVVAGAVITGGVLGTRDGVDERMPQGELGEIR